MHIYLVGGFNPSEKYQSNWKSSPIFGVKIPKIFELPPPRYAYATGSASYFPKKNLLTPPPPKKTSFNVELPGFTVVYQW